MSGAGPEQVVVETPRRHRWLRREVWFVIGALVVIAAVALIYRRHPPTHVAPGAPYGGVPEGAVAVPNPRPAPTAPAPAT